MSAMSTAPKGHSQTKIKTVRRGKKKVKTLVPKVTKYIKAKDSKEKPLVDKLNDVYIGTPFGRRLITSYPMIDKDFFITDATLKAEIGSLSFPEIKGTVAYMLKQGKLKNPETFQGFEDMKKATGRDILVHEILKQPIDVLENFFQIAGRTKYENTEKRKKQTNPLTHEKESVPYEKYDYVPEQRGEIESITTNNQPYYEKVSGDNDRILVTNVGSPANDGLIYLNHPIRVIKGYVDSSDDRVSELCGPDMERFMRRTAHEFDRDEEYSNYATEREDIAEKIRIFCPVDELRTEKFLDKLKSGRPLDSFNKLDDETIAELKSFGYTDDAIEEMYSEEPIPSADSTNEQNSEISKVTTNQPFDQDTESDVSTAEQEQEGESTPSGDMQTAYDI